MGRTWGSLVGHQPWLASSRCLDLQVLTDLSVGRPCHVIRALGGGAPGGAPSSPASGLGSMAGSGQETARLWWQVGGGF